MNNESGFYFEVKRGEIKIGDDFIDSDQVNKLFRNLITLEFVGNIYAVRPCDLEKIKNNNYQIKKQYHENCSTSYRKQRDRRPFRTL